MKKELLLKIPQTLKDNKCYEQLYGNKFNSFQKWKISLKITIY